MHRYRRSKRHWRGNRQAPARRRLSPTFCDVDKENGERLAADLSHDNHAAYFVRCDIKNDADVSRMVEVAARLGIPLYG
jgi:hypothetical protein